MPPALPEPVLAALRCPHCDGVLTGGDGAVRCTNGHSFDIARQGYVNLVSGRAGAAGLGDTAQMVAAREGFFAAGHYTPLAARIAAWAAELEPRLVLDAGAGPGWYLTAVLERVPEAYGLAADVSKYATRRAAKAHPRIGAVTCDVWARLPIADASIDLVLNVFAPRNGPEFARVLRRSGRVLVVTPTADHLRELVGRLVLMGPSAHHVDRAELAARLGERSEPLDVTAAFELAVYRVR